MNLDSLPISPNEGQQNMDKLSNTFLDMVGDSMGVLQDSTPEGRPFLADCNLFGYDGVVVADGKIASLVNLKGGEGIPPVKIGTQLKIRGNSQGYVSSGHKPDSLVKVIRIIEPFYTAKPGLQSSDKIIKVEGDNVIGWIKPSEFDEKVLYEEQLEEAQKLFAKNSDTPQGPTL